MSLALNKLRLLAVTVTVPLMIFNLTTFLVGLPAGLAGYADFRHLYTAGYMIRTGHPTELHEAVPNREFQDRVVSYGSGRTLTFNHLAYEALLFVPLSLLSYRQAYWSFLALNVALFLLAYRLLRARFGVVPMPRWFLPTVFLAFLPVIFALDEGQDSLILLVLMAGVAISLDLGRDFQAGALLGLTLFKFQFALPIALLYLVWRRWRLIAGFACTGIAVLAMSLWTVGVPEFRHYLHSLRASSVELSSGLETTLGIHPSAMTNLRGLAYGVFHGWLSQTELQILTLVVSAALLAWAATRRPSFSLAIVAAVLVSYHCFADDAVLLLIPMSARIGNLLRGALRTWEGVLAATLLASPTILLHSGERYCLMVIPILAYIAELQS